MKRFVLSFLVFAPLAAFAQTEGPAPTDALTKEITAVDAKFFAAFFDRCDIDVLKSMISDDFEMIHDKNGFVARSGKEMIDALVQTCARQKTGEDFKSRRELVPGTLKVFPVNNLGAIETGEHRFYKLTPGKPEQLSEVGLFVQVWKKEPSGWKLVRVMSYGHHLVK